MPRMKDKSPLAVSLESVPIQTHSNRVNIYLIAFLSIDNII